MTGAGAGKDDVASAADRLCTVVLQRAVVEGDGRGVQVHPAADVGDAVDLQIDVGAQLHARKQAAGGGQHKAGVGGEFVACTATAEHGVGAAAVEGDTVEAQAREVQGAGLKIQVADDVDHARGLGEQTANEPGAGEAAIQVEGAPGGVDGAGIAPGGGAAGGLTEVEGTGGDTDGAGVDEAGGVPGLAGLGGIERAPEVDGIGGVVAQAGGAPGAAGAEGDVGADGQRRAGVVAVDLTGAGAGKDDVASAADRLCTVVLQRAVVEGDCCAIESQPAAEVHGAIDVQPSGQRHIGQRATVRVERSAIAGRHCAAIE